VPNFKVPVQDDDGETYSVHFAALFSARKDATPLILLHGWPGSFLEFLPLLQKLMTTATTPEQLPYHIVVPSLPGYGLTTSVTTGSPGTPRDLRVADVARIMHKLMLKLGFGAGGYVAQGGDVGSAVTTNMVKTFDECIGKFFSIFFFFSCPTLPLE
jgi:microsomal epoxide hydrolase